ncbi:hypothetical protein ACFU99_27460 [Streptomyces sp. NPDC057654]|uniref:hypothetical protein n=1 Tax=Streptomyces sp. NPDC057654 TaxID=3346196 RepID=UPI0036911262
MTNLLRWESPLDSLVRTANRYDGHAAAMAATEALGNPVTLDRRAARCVLHRCASGELDVKELPEWAFAVHMLDSVDIDEADIELLTQFLTEASSPELYEPVTTDLCQRWLTRLG